MQRQCAVCQREFQAKRASARYCGNACRQRAHRAAPLKVAKSQDANASADSPTVAAVRAALESASRADGYLGATALTLAARVDDTPGAGAATVARELRAVMSEALRDAALADDPVDEVKQRRDAKLASLAR